MLIYILKTLVSAIILVAVSEVSKRSGFIGGLIASLPLVSLMAIVWLYVDTRDVGKVSALSASIFWMVLPSLPLFLMLPTLLKKAVPFYPALLVSCGLTVLLYVSANLLYARLGIKL